MRLPHELITQDLIDSELVKLKFVFDRCEYFWSISFDDIRLTSIAVHHDNRDFDILPNYQPRGALTVNEQTLLFGTSPGVSAALSPWKY